MPPENLPEQNIPFLQANQSASNVGEDDSEDINRDTSQSVDLNQLGNSSQQHQEDAAALQFE